MLEFALGALVISLLAGLLGFTGIARGAAAVAKIIFWIFIVGAAILFLLFLIGGALAV
jgi:uncharacterized membrane protein YtjA (UPF0391 family)